MSSNFRDQEELNARKRASLLQIKYFDVRTLDHLPVFEGVFTKEEMYRNHCVMLSRENGVVILAITSATPQPALRQLRERFPDYRVRFVLISESGFQEFMQKYDPPEKVEYSDIELKQDGDADQQANIQETIEKVHADDVFNYLVRQAKKLGASDIHLENQEENVKVRFRVDGVLHHIVDMSFEKYRQLSSTIAIQADIGTDVPDAQTGHMSHKITNDDGSVLSEVNMRIETIPTLNGQDAVIRLFNLERDLLQLENLGMSDKQKESINGVIEHPAGLVLAVGPTGSGKTTTLYSIINHLNQPSRKIITLEDPVEYTLPGLVQVPVDTDKHKSFANALRAILRLDPDVIMMGEVRDSDTAKTALRASLSGHLVLSTFHASDTMTAISRLKEYFGDNPLLTSAVRLIVAQRLVRRLDDSTKQEYEPEEHVKERIRKSFENLPQGVERPDLDNIKLYRPGTSDDVPFGYKGQVAVVEVANITHELEKLINTPGGIDHEDLQRQAVQDGMVTLEQDGLRKALQGITSIEEIYRVI